MTGLLIKLITMAIVATSIYFGVRRIWRDWSGKFKEDDRKRRERDLRERDDPDVVTLRRDSDGVFRPGSNKKDDA